LAGRTQVCARCIGGPGRSAAFVLSPCDTRQRCSSSSSTAGSGRRTRPRSSSHRPSQQQQGPAGSTQPRGQGSSGPPLRGGAAAAAAHAGRVCSGPCRPLPAARSGWGHASELGSEGGQGVYEWWPSHPDISPCHATPLPHARTGARSTLHVRAALTAEKAALDIKKVRRDS
jgi:hypothetical protein